MNEETLFTKGGAADRPTDYGGPRAWLHSEIAGAATANAKWIEKNPLNGFVTYPKRNQNQQSSCVSYSFAKLLAIDEFSENGMYRELSPRSMYAYTHIPGGGSSSLDSAKFATKFGMTLEHLFQTDNLQEADVITDKGFAVDAKQVALVYKPQNYMECDAYFDTIADIIETHRMAGIKKGVGISMIGVNNGTVLTNYPMPPKQGEQNIWYHRITVTDYGLIGGKKYLAIDNSLGIVAGNQGQQFLGIEWQPFIYGGIYTLNLPDNWQQTAANSVPMPSYQWNVDLQYGSIGPDVKILQQALQTMGMFPISSVVAPTGNYFGLTQKAVELFQAALAIPVTGKVDALTREKLNSIFK